MSYCVNCGVELDKTCSVCPLCNTKVINPNQPVDTVSPKPYPVDKGYVDSGIRKETAILMAVCLATTAVVCGLLNLFFITFSHWSFYVIGTCIVLWIFCLPIFFPTKAVFRITLLLDGLGIAMYFGIIAWLHPGNGWYTAIALPLIILGTLAVFFFAISMGHPRSSILSQAVILVAEIGIYSVCVELLTRRYYAVPMALSCVRHCPHLRYYHRRDTGDYPAAKPVEGGSPEKDAYIKIRTYNYAFKNVKKQS